MRRKFLAGLLAAVMVLALLPVNALAASEKTANSTSTLLSAVSSAASGDTIRLTGNIDFTNVTNYTTVSGVYEGISVNHKDTQYREYYVLHGTTYEYDSFNQYVKEESNSVKNLDAQCNVYIHGKNLTLNLNGYTITGSQSMATAVASVIFVDGGGTLTITGSGGIKTHAAAVTASGEGTVVNVQNGALEGFRAVASINKATANVTGGTLKGGADATAPWQSIEVTPKEEHGPFQPSAGIFHAWYKYYEHHVISDTAVHPLYGGALYTRSDGKINVSGGTISSGALLIGSDAFPNPSWPIKVTGGTFTLADALANSAAVNNLSITGGTFANDPSAYIRAASHEAVANSNGTFSVYSYANAAARYTTSSGTTAYADTLQAAVNAAAAGGTVTLLKDVSTPVTIGKSLTLDLGGRTLSTGASNAITTTSGADVMVRNGTVSTTGYALYASGGKLSVTGGTFTGRLGQSSGALSLKGGSYSVAPTAYLAEGCTAKESSGRYTVLLGDAVYEIGSKSDLLAFKDLVANGNTSLNAILTADIDMSGVEWTTPIGYLDTAYTYTGTFDGNGHIIKNLTGSTPLFHTICEGGGIKNLGIVASAFAIDYNSYYMAAFCERNYGTIEGCYNTGKVASGQPGGICGGNYGTIKRCYNTGLISRSNGDSGFYSGGISSFNSGTIQDCYNAGAIFGNTAGGIASDNTGTIINCYNIGTVLINVAMSEGIAKRNTGTITNCYNDSTKAKVDLGGTNMSTAAFTSGEVAYLLNGSTASGAWYQKIGVDPAPVLDSSHGSVYKSGSSYANNVLNSIPTPTAITGVPGGSAKTAAGLRLPATVSLSTAAGTLSAPVAWNVDGCTYNPANPDAQTFSVSGTVTLPAGLGNPSNRSTTVTVSVSVLAASVQSLTVAGKPLLKYTEGGKLDLSGLTLRAVYVGGGSKPLSYGESGVTASYTNGIALTKATHNGKTLTASFGGKTVTVGTLQVLNNNGDLKTLTVGSVALDADRLHGTAIPVVLPYGESLPASITATAADAAASVSAPASTDGGKTWTFFVTSEYGTRTTYTVNVSNAPDPQVVVPETKDKISTHTWEIAQTTANEKEKVDTWIMDQFAQFTLAADVTRTETQLTPAVAGSRNDHDGTDGKFTFTVTISSGTGGYKVTDTVDVVGKITPTPYNVPVYTVSFDGTGGSSTTSQRVNEDAKATKPADPTRTDYRFTGWYTDAACKNQFSFDTQIDKPTTLYAGWEWSKSAGALSFARTVPGNPGATGATGYHIGDTISISATFKLAAQRTNTLNALPPQVTFTTGGKTLGTVTAETGDGGQTYTATLPVTLGQGELTAAKSYDITATFSGGPTLDGSAKTAALTVEPEIFTVTFDGKSGTTPEAQYIVGGGKASEPAKPTRQDYVFTGWYTDAACNNSFNFSTPITETKTLYAGWDWSKSEGKVTFERTTAGNPGADETGVFRIGDTLSVAATFKLTAQPVMNTLNALPQQVIFTTGGKTLDTKTATPNGDGTYTATLSVTLGETDGLTNAGAHDITAEFTGSATLDGGTHTATLTVAPEIFTVTFDDAGGSETDPQYVVDGETASSPIAPTREDYRFTGWNAEGGEPFDFDAAITGPTTIRAGWAWSKSEGDLEFLRVAAANPDAGEADSVYRLGDTVSVTASFALAEPPTMNTLNVDPDQIIFRVGDTELETVTAQTGDGLTYTASINVELSGTVFTGDDTYTITAEYTGNSTLDGSTKTADLIVLPRIYTVTFDGKGGATTKNQYIVDGSAASEPTAPTRKDYVFTGWYTDKECADSFHFSTSITEAKTLYAGWAWSKSEGALSFERTTAGNPAAHEIDIFRIGDTVSIAATFTLTNPPMVNALNAEPEQIIFRVGNTELGTKNAETDDGYTYTAAITVTLGQDGLTSAGAYEITAEFTGGSKLDGSAATAPLTVEPEIFTVTFNGNEGGNAPGEQYVVDGAYATLPGTIPTREDYRFTGWNTEGGEPFDFNETAITDDITLYADWTWSQSAVTVEITRAKAGNPGAGESSIYRIGDDVNITATARLTDELNTNTLSLDEFMFYVGDPEHGGVLLGTEAVSTADGTYTATLKNVRLGGENLPDDGSYDIYAVFTGNAVLDGSTGQTTLNVAKQIFTVNFSVSEGSGEPAAQYVVDGAYAAEPIGIPTRADYRFTGWNTKGGEPFDFNSDAITEDITLYAGWEWSQSEVAVEIARTHAANEAAPEGFYLGDTISLTATARLTEAPNVNALSLNEFTFYVGDPNNGGRLLGTVDAQQNGKAYTATLENVALGNGEHQLADGVYTIYAVFSGNSTLDGSTGTAALTVQKEIFTVTFDSADGLPVPPQYVLNGDKLDAPAASRAGYTLDGWWDGETKLTADTAITNHIEYTAHWTANTYTVAFDPNGGEGTVAGMELTYDGAATALTENAFTRQNYKFAGWNTKADGKGTSYADQQAVENLSTGEGVTLYAQWTEQSRYAVSGSLKDAESNPVPGAVIALRRGNDVAAETTTDNLGGFTFPSVLPGTYNIVMTKGEQTVTALANVTDKNVTVGALALPPEGVSSVLEVSGDETPDVIVGGLDEEAIQIHENESTGEVEKKPVSVSMKVETQAPITKTENLTPEETAKKEVQQAIQQTAPSRQLEYLDFNLTKTVDEETSPLTETATVLEIIIPFDFSRKTNITIYRYHDGAAAALTPLTALPESDAKEDGTFYADQAGGAIYVYTSQFSTYAVGYTVRSGGGGGTGGSGGGGAGGSGPQASVEGVGGNVSVSGTTVTITPDKGYQIATVTVNGKAADIPESGKLTGLKNTDKVVVTFEKIPETPDVSDPLAKFTDLQPGAWYSDAVRYVVEHGLFAGTSGTTFSPDATMTRAMLVTVLYRAAGEPSIEDEIWGYPFADVDAESWYGTAVYWARLKGITSGTSEVTFSPDGTLTREQLATMLWRYAGSPATTGTLDGFTDATAAGSYATDALKWAVEQGILTGKGGGILDPKGEATRAQVAAMLMRYLQD